MCKARQGIKVTKKEKVSKQQNKNFEIHHPSFILTNIHFIVKINWICVNFIYKMLPFNCEFFSQKFVFIQEISALNWKWKLCLHLLINFSLCRRNLFSLQHNRRQFKRKKSQTPVYLELSFPLHFQTESWHGLANKLSNPFCSKGFRYSRGNKWQKSWPLPYWYRSSTKAAARNWSPLKEMELYWSQFGNWVIATTTGIQTVQGIKTLNAKKKVKIWRLFMMFSSAKPVE